MELKNVSDIYETIKARKMQMIEYCDHAIKEGNVKDLEYFYGKMMAFSEVLGMFEYIDLN